MGVQGRVVPVHRLPYEPHLRRQHPNAGRYLHRPLLRRHQPAALQHADHDTAGHPDDRRRMDAGHRGLPASVGRLEPLRVPAREVLVHSPVAQSPLLRSNLHPLLVPHLFRHAAHGDAVGVRRYIPRRQGQQREGAAQQRHSGQRGGTVADSAKVQQAAKQHGPHNPQPEVEHIQSHQLAAVAPGRMEGSHHQHAGRLDVHRVLAPLFRHYCSRIFCDAQHEGHSPYPARSSHPPGSVELRFQPPRLRIPQ
ncbi:hypothetical protein Ahia01_001093700 [Argonauta hians]